MNKMKMARILSLTLIPVFYLAATRKKNIEVPADLKDALNDDSAELNSDGAAKLVDRARQQSQVAASAPTPSAPKSVEISDGAAPNEVKLPGNALTEELKGLLAGLDKKKLQLVKAIHSAPNDQAGSLGSGFVCAPEATVAFANDDPANPYIAYFSDSSSEYEYLHLRGNGLDVSFPWGIALTRSVTKIFQVPSAKSHYRIYSSYWAKIGSVAMIASTHMVNELEVWKTGDQIFVKQKHRFSGNGVADRSKECLFKLL